MVEDVLMSEILFTVSKCCCHTVPNIVFPLNYQFQAQKFKIKYFKKIFMDYPSQHASLKFHDNIKCMLSCLHKLHYIAVNSLTFIVYIVCLQHFDTIGWVPERASSL